MLVHKLRSVEKTAKPRDSDDHSVLKALTSVLSELTQTAWPTLALMGGLEAGPSLGCVCFDNVEEGEAVLNVPQASAVLNVLPASVLKVGLNHRNASIFSNGFNRQVKLDVSFDIFCIFLMMALF